VSGTKPTSSAACPRDHERCEQHRAAVERELPVLRVPAGREAVHHPAADRRPGIAVWQNNGIAANQAVAHVHFHVAGTLEEGGTQWGEVPRLSVAETDAMAERLRQAEASLSSGLA
jgi:histidine triad (HIT) family protein